MFKNMKLAVKIGGGFAIILILTAAVGFIGWNGMTGVVDRVDKADDANRLVKYMLEARQQEKNYIIRGDSEYIEKVAAIITNVKEQAAATRAKFKQSANQKQMDDILAAVNSYEKAFNQFVDLREERTLADGKMVAAARAAQAKAEEVRQEQKAEYAQLFEAGAEKSILDDKLIKADDANRIIKWILDCRRDEKNYQLRDDLEYKDRVNETTAEIINLAKDMRSRFRQAHNQEQTDLLITETQAYVAAFDEFIEIDVNMDKAEEEMVQAARKTDEVANAARADQKGKMEDEIATATMMILVGAVIAVVFGLLMAVLITLSITGAMNKGVVFAGAIARGNLNVKLNVNQKDEIGKMMDALRDMVESFRYKAQIVDIIAKGDLTSKIEKTSDEDGLGQSLIEMNDSLSDLVSQLTDAVEQVSAGSDQVSQASQALSQGATEQASSLEEISSSLNEINSQTKQNAENASEANALAKTSTENAQNGNNQMQELVAAMDKINTSSDEIKKVVKVIDDIAFQTNLLALNANVEAARAGKYGKGFAVVAEEVRNLAVRSAEATKETTAMVEESIRNIGEGTKAAELTAKQLDDIVNVSAKVADFLAEIALASKEQAQGVDQITSGVDQIDQVTQSNTASAEESASASEELAAQGQQLKGLIARFKVAGNGGNKVRKEQKAIIAGHTKIKTASTTQEEDGNGNGSIRNAQKGVAVAVKNKNQEPTDPKEVIKLDDDDFDRF